MRYALLLCLLFLLSIIPSINGIIINDDGIDTSKGFIKWESLINLQNKINRLDNELKVLITTIIIMTGVLVYTAYVAHCEAKTEAEPPLSDLPLAR